jgi:glycosyltransferase involved in cell wall biosynthesis
MLISEGVDLYFTSHYTVDRECPVPFVFTIYDLIRLRLPEFSYTDATFADRFGTEELDLIRDELGALASWDEPQDNEELFTRYFRAINRYLGQRAAKIVTISRSSANDIQSMLGVPPERLTIVRCGVDGNVFAPNDDAHVRPVLRRYGITGSYLMFVGLTHPHKRFLWLLEQLVARRHDLPPGTHLVAVGGHAENTFGVAELLAQYRAEDFLIFTGRISDSELAALYSGASALVVASLSEGSNLPALEGLACGCPVIATDIPPLREALSDSVSYYNPAAGEEMAQLAAAALAGHLRGGIDRFRPPSWEDAGSHLASILSGAAGGE